MQEVKNSFLKNIRTIDTYNKNKEWNGCLLTLVNMNEPGTAKIDQVYITMCKANDIKGPHMHRGIKMDRFYCIEGKVAVVCRNEETKEMSEYVLEAFDDQLLIIPPWNSHALVALDGQKAAVLSIPTEGYNPNFPYNQTETEYKDYNWEKWK